MRDALNVKVFADLRNYQMAMARLPGITKAATSRATTAVMGLAMAVGGLGVAATRVGANFQQTMVETATVTKATTKEFDDMIKKARELGKTTTFTASQAGKGMYYLASAGFKATEVIQAADYSLKLAGATASDVDYTMASVAATIKQFGLAASETKRITDTFAQAISTSQLTMWRLTEALKYAGTAGAGFGLTLEDTVAALAQYANLGLEGSMIGTQFRRAMTMAAKGTAKSEEALRKYGMTQRDINPEMQGFVGILKQIGNAGVTATDAIKMFGIRAGANMARLGAMYKQGLLPIEEYANSLIKAQEGMGRTQEMYNQMMNTFKSQGIIVMSALQDMLIEVFNLYSKEGQTVFEEMTKEIWKITEAIYKNRDVLGKWAGNVVKTLYTAIRVLKVLAKAAWEARYFLAAIFAKQMIVNIYKWAIALDQVIRQMKLLTLSWAALGGWLTIVSAGVLAFFAFDELYKEFKTFRDIIDRVVIGWKMLITDIKFMIMKIVKAVTMAIENLAKDIQFKLLNSFKKVFTALILLVDKLPEALKPDWFENNKREMLLWAAETENSAVSLDELIGQIQLAIQDLSKEQEEQIFLLREELRLRQYESEIIEKNRNAQTSGMEEQQKIQEKHQKQVQKILDMWKDVPEDTIKALDTIEQKYHDVFDISNQWKEILESISEIEKKAQWDQEGWARGVLDMMEDMFNALKKFAELERKIMIIELKKDVVESVRTLDEEWRAFFRRHGTALQGAAAGWNDYWDSVMTGSERAANAMEEFLQGFHDGLSDTLFMGIKGEMDKFEQVWEDFGDRLLKLWTDKFANDFMTVLKDSVESGAIGNFLDKIGLGEFGREISKTKKDPKLEIMETQLALQQQDLEIQQKILLAVEAEREAVENTAGGQWTSMGPLGSIKYPSGVARSLSSMTSISDLSTLKDLYLEGIGTPSTQAAHQAGVQGPGLPSGQFGSQLPSSGGGGWMSNMGTYGNYAMSAYGMYTLTQKKQYEGMSKGSAAMSGAMQGAQYGSAFGMYGMAAGAVIGGVSGLVQGGDDSEEKGLKRVKEYQEEVQKLMETNYESLTSMTRDFHKVLSHKHVEAMVKFGGITRQEGQVLHWLAEMFELAKNSAGQFGTVLGSVTTYMKWNFELMEEQMTVMGMTGSKTWETVKQLAEKVEKLGVAEAMRRASTSLSDAALVQYNAFIQLANGTDLLTIANDQAAISLELLGDTLGKTDDQIMGLWNTFKEVKEEQQRLIKVQEELTYWSQVLDEEWNKLSDEEILAITSRMEQLGLSMNNTFQQMHKTFDDLNQQITYTAEMIYNLPKGLGGIRDALGKVVVTTRVLSAAAEATLTMVEYSGKIAESWKEIRDAVAESDFEKVASEMAKITFSYGQMGASLMEMAKIADYGGLKGLANLGGNIGGIFILLEGLGTIMQILMALGKMVEGMIQQSAVWISRSEESVKKWNDLAKATENLPIIGKWIAKFVERINTAADAAENIDSDLMYKQIDSYKDFMEELDETIRTFWFEDTIADMRSSVEHFRGIVIAEWGDSFDSMEEMVDRNVENTKDYVNALSDLADALKELKKAWEDFIGDIESTQKDLETEYLKPEQRRKYAMDEWVETYSEYMKASDEERLEKAIELRDIAMEWYQAEKDIMLERHEKEMERAEELIDIIETTREKQQEFLKSIDEQIQQMKFSIGTPGDEFTYMRNEIDRLKTEIGAASGDERLALIEELQGLYATYLAKGESNYGKSSQSYDKIWHDVKRGLELLKEQYKIETDSMIEQAEGELEVLTGTRDTTLAIEALAERQRQELHNLNLKWAEYLTWFKTDAETEIEGINTELDNIYTDINYIRNNMKYWFDTSLKENSLTKNQAKDAVYLGIMGAIGSVTFGAIVKSLLGLQVGMDYVPHDQWRYLHEGEKVVRKDMPADSSGGGGGSQHFIFVPYNMSENEQERLFNEVVKPQLLARSENEQFIYDNAVIKTNRGT